MLTASRTDGRSPALEKYLPVRGVLARIERALTVDTATGDADGMRHLAPLAELVEMKRSSFASRGVLDVASPVLPAGHLITPPLVGRLECTIVVHTRVGQFLLF